MTPKTFLFDNTRKPIAELPELAEIIYTFREGRNSMVHEIATRLGRTSKTMVESQ